LVTFVFFFEASITGGLLVLVGLVSKESADSTASGAISSSGDTSVLLAIYGYFLENCLGISCLSYLDGISAFSNLSDLSGDSGNPFNSCSSSGVS
jgi:hypothetical protein